MKKINKLLVVGGGTAGLISALILKKHLDIDIDLVHSKNIGIIGVGEGSTEHFRDFADFIGIDQYSIIKECDATYKSGIMFQGWGKKDYLHSVVGEFSNRNSQYYSLYAKLISENNPYMNFDFLWRNRADKKYYNREEEWPFNQFHFNTHKLNEFLTKIAKSVGINIIEDDIENINLDDQGYIKSLQGQKSVYNYDFYLDATGFKRLLMNKLGAKWNSYSKYLKMKSAITFQTPDEDEYNIWTLAKAMDFGWLFRIPVWGRYGNGYIFDSDYISADQAKQEVEILAGREIDVGKQFNFDPGCLDQVWIKNCCAVGLSGSFVEPLEASSIGTTIQQTFLLMHKLTNYDEKTISNYNDTFHNIMENIRDFIVLHYITDKDNTEFWKNNKTAEIPDSLKTRLDRWKHHLPIYEDFNKDSDYKLFGPANFILVMEGLNLFDRESIKIEYNQLNKYHRDAADTALLNLSNHDKNLETITHKQLLWLIRNV
jgi:hypothetical protein